MKNDTLKRVTDDQITAALRAWFNLADYNFSNNDTWRVRMKAALEAAQNVLT